MNNRQLVSEIDENIHLVVEDVLYIFRLLVAFIFIIVGFIGILLPVIPDWPLLLVGVVLLDAHGSFRRKILRKTPPKYRKYLRKILFVVKIKEIGGKDERKR